MNFENLKLSLSGYQNTAPTIFQVICTIKSLFDDIEEDYGLEVCQCEAGSESFPTELYWLCTQIREIYGEQKEVLSSRPRVEDAVKKLDTIRAELEQMAGVAEKLKAVEAEYQLLSNDLMAQREMEVRWVRLTQEIEQAKAQRADLKGYDFDGTQKELEELQREIAELQGEKTSLEKGLEGARMDRDGLIRMIDAIKNQLQQVKQEIEMLKSQLQELQQAVKAAEADRNRLEEEVDRFAQIYYDLESEIANLQNQINVYEEQQLKPLRDKKNDLQKEVEDLDRQRGELEEIYNDSNEQRENMILSISRQKSANEKMEETIRSNQTKLEQMEDEARQLETRVAGIVSRLSLAQDEVELLKEQKLPEAKTLLEDEQNRKDKLSKEIQDLTEEKNRVICEISGLEQKLPDLLKQMEPLAQKLENTQQSYNEMVAKVTTGNENLRKLEENIKELQSKNPEENYILYHNQLLEEKRKLEDYDVKLRGIRQEMQALQDDINQKKQEAEKLQAQKEQYEADFARLKSLRQKLEPVATEGNARRMEEIGQQLRLLETVCNRLAGSVELLRRNLGKDAFDEKLSLDDRFQVTLKDLKFRTDELRKALVDCADSLKGVTKV